MRPDERNPDEFARLLALPADHPDRQRAMDSPAFEARRRLHEQFVAPAADVVPAETLATAERELRARLPRVMGAGVPTPDVRDASPASRAEGRARAAWLRRPGMRAVLSLAASIAIVAGAAWLWPRVPAPRPVRGSSETGAFALEAPRASGRAVELSWTPEPLADRYRLVFYGSDLNEVAHVDDLAPARFVLRADALPAGLRSGSVVLVAVVAMRSGDPIATSKTRTVRIP